MYYQKQKGFYLYYYNNQGVLSFYYYNTLEDFFKSHSEWFIKNHLTFSIHKHLNDIFDPTYAQYCKNDWEPSDTSMVLYDELGNLYVPDRIVGLYRKWVDNRYKYTHRRRKSTYGNFRKIKTFQECKMSYDFDDYNIKCRPNRNHANLPDAWYDIMSHNDKSWKTQSKRKHQYKEIKW